MRMITEELLEAEALKAIRKSPDGQLILLGHPIGTPQSADQTEKVEEGVWCDECGNAVQSTVLKEKIRELTRHREHPAIILCHKCMEEFVDTLGG